MDKQDTIGCSNELENGCIQPIQNEKESKKMKYRGHGVIIAFCIFLCSCSATITRIPTQDTTVTSALLRMKSETPTITKIPDVDFIPTASFTPCPTYDILEQAYWINNVMNNDDQCRFPCWWGITPGNTNWNDAKNILFIAGISYNKIINSNDENTYEIVGWPEESDLAFGKTMTINVDHKGVVSSIDIQSSVINTEYDKDRFVQYWKNFTPESIMNFYGTPTEIYIETFRGRGESGYQPSNMIINIYLFYEQYGILITYGGLVPISDIYRICPTFSAWGNLDGRWLNIHIISIENDYKTVYPELFTTGTLKTLFEATGVTVQDFYDYFITYDAMMCVETPRSIWP